MKFNSIFKAAKDGTVRDVTFFIENGTDINVRGDDGRTPLHVVACHNSNVEVLKYLISKGAGVRLKNGTGQTPLDVASTDAKKRILREAMGLSKFEDIFKAAECGAVRDIASFVENGFDIGSKDNDEWTPLHFATRYNSNVEVLEYIIAQGADVNAKSKDGKTPLGVAATKEKTRILCEAMGMSPVGSIFEAAKSGTIMEVACFIENGIDFRAKDKEESATPLHFAARYNSSVDVLEYLVSLGADIDAKDKHGLTPLHLATIAGKTNIVRLLLNLDANANEVIEDEKHQDRGKSPLHLAALSGNKDTVELLLAAGADVNKAIEEGSIAKRVQHAGRTPIDLAVASGDVNTIRVLIDVGALLGASCIKKAVEMQSLEILNILIKAGADVNQVDQHGTSLLHHAIGKANEDIVSVLIKVGANVNAISSKLGTPLELARLRAKTTIIPILLAAGAQE